MSGSTYTINNVNVTAEEYAAAYAARFGGQFGGAIPPGGSLSAPQGTPTPSVNNAATQPGLQGANVGTPNNPAAAAVGGTLNGTATSAPSNGELPVQSTATNLTDAGGRRVRLRPKPAAMDQILGTSGLMSPLSAKGTNGLVFPYQPTITWAQDVNYTQMEIVHANQDFYSYSKTPALKLSIEGEFTVQNQKEGLYALACIQFLRTVTKMWFGGNTAGSKNLAGTPPPVLLFDAYGQWMFNELPVIITQFSITLPKDVDYVSVQTAYSVNNSLISANDQTIVTANPTIAAANAFTNINYPAAAVNQSQGFAWLPSVFSISVQLTVQNTPQRLRAFDLDKFRTGELLAGGSWI